MLYIIYAHNTYDMHACITVYKHEKHCASVHVVLSWLPMMHGMRVFNVLELKFTPFNFKFVLCMELTL